MTTAEIILNQIDTMDKMALWAWGSRNFLNTGNGVKFKVNGTKTKKGSSCTITLNGKDLYDIKISRNIRGEEKVDATANDIYADMLVEVLDELIG